MRSIGVFGESGFGPSTCHCGTEGIGPLIGEVGSYLTSYLVVFVPGCLSLDLLLAIVARKKFMGKKFKDSILKIFNIFNIKIKINK